MITIDIWTKEDLQNWDRMSAEHQAILKSIDSKEQAYLDQIEKLPKGTEENPTDLTPLYDSLDEQEQDILHSALDKLSNATQLSIDMDALKRKVHDRYKSSHTNDEILDDVRKVVSSIEKSDYLEFIKNVRTWTAEMTPTSEEHKAFISMVENQLCTEGYSSCFDFISGRVSNQIIALIADKPYADKARAIINERISLWYPKPAELTPQTTATTTESLSFTYPTEHMQNLTKASTVLFDNDIDLVEDLQQLEIDITPNRVKSKSKLTDKYLVPIDISAPELTGVDKVTNYDGSVQNSVISVAMANPHRFFTAKQVATHLLYGDNQYDNNPTKQRIESVTKSIEKQRLTDITIDYTQHAKLNGVLKEGDSCKITNYMLPVKEYEATINGQKLRGWKLMDTPPLYEYASRIGQIGEIPAKMLDVPVNLDEEKIVIRDFLLREITHMTKNPHWSKTITLDRILKVANIENPAEKTATTTTASKANKRSKTATIVRTMLKEWTDKRFIKGYIENRKGKTIRSYTIQTL